MIEKIRFNDSIEINIFNNVNDLYARASQLFIQEFNKGLCIVSGGNTPKSIYNVISNQTNVKANRKILLADDRLVDENNVLSNYKMLTESLDIEYFDGFPISYFEVLKSKGVPFLQGQIKKVLENNCLYSSFLGIGSDGHTASLFSENSNFNSELNSFKVKNKFDNYDRFSLSYKSLMRSEQIVFLAIGLSKNKPLQEFFSNNIDFEKYPFHKLASNHRNVKFYCDNEALTNVEL
tara:strand:- start:684 stop:1388 length:705 start_codon:yes stop_codon:yes gene_type:complete